MIFYCVTLHAMLDSMRNIAIGKDHGTAVGPLLHTKRDAAALLSVSLRTIDNLIARKQMKCVRIGRRVLVSTQEIGRVANSGIPYGRAA